jgi:hypothetical protein
MWFSEVPKKSTQPQLLDYWMKGNVVDNIKIKHDSSKKTYNKINNFKPSVLSKVNKSSKKN